MSSHALSQQLNFLTDAAHLLSTSAPETSAFLMSHQSALLHRNNFEQPDVQRQHVCGCCSHIMVPGQDATTLKIQSKEASRKKQRSLDRDGRARATERRQPPGTLKVFTCGNCNRYTRIPLPPPNHISRKKTSKPEPTSAQSPAPKPSQSASSKKRAKSRKAGLQALLDRRQAPAPAAGLGLTLSDFMKK